MANNRVVSLRLALPPVLKPRRKRKPTPEKGIAFNPAATLRPIAWGACDKALAWTVCTHLAETMPPTGKGFGTPWHYAPKRELPTWCGWLGVAVVFGSVLAGIVR